MCRSYLIFVMKKSLGGVVGLKKNSNSLTSHVLVLYLCIY